MKNLKGSDLLIKCLADLDLIVIWNGWPWKYGNPGCTVQGRKKGFKTYIVHDESVASAAGGYFKATGKPGLLFVTNGPGMMQAIPGLVEQAMENSAIIVVSGDIPTAQWGYGAEEELDIYQDDDQTTLYRGFAKRIFNVVDPKQIPDAVVRAYTTAMGGRTGVVLINIPVDVQSKVITKEMLEKDYRLKERAIIDRPRGSREAVEKAAELLANAEAPMIICGVGAVISDASDEVIELAELLDAPVGTAYMGQAIMAETIPTMQEELEDGAINMPIKQHGILML